MDRTLSVRPAFLDGPDAECARSCFRRSCPRAPGAAVRMAAGVFRMDRMLSVRGRLFGWTGRWVSGRTSADTSRPASGRRPTVRPDSGRTQRTVRTAAIPLR